jgi:hypothetical protein
VRVEILVHSLALLNNTLVNLKLSRLPLDFNWIWDLTFFGRLISSFRGDCARSGSASSALGILDIRLSISFRPCFEGEGCEFGVGNGTSGVVFSMVLRTDMLRGHDHICAQVRLSEFENDAWSRAK